MLSLTLSLKSAVTSSKLLLPAQSVLFWLKLLVPAELYVTWERSVFPVGQTLLHVPQRHLCAGRSIPRGQLVAIQYFLVSGIFWTTLKENIWNAVVNRCANSFELVP